MILFQVRDLAAKACGEPHVAPSWEIAKASLGAMLAKTPDLAERAKAIRVDYVCDWDPENGLIDVHTTYLDSESGDVCLDQFRAAVAAEERTADAGYDYTPGMKGDLQSPGDPRVHDIPETSEEIFGK